MKSTEPENRLVDYLYDELGEKDRKAVAAQLKADEGAAAEVTAYASLLKLYREESEEITPSVAATERILAEARRASRPWYAALLGDWLPSLLLRPAVGFAVVAVLVVGVGVFAFLSNRGETTGEPPSSRAARSRAASPRAAKPSSLAEAAEAPREGRGLVDLRKGAGGAGFERGADPDQAGALALGTGNGAKDKSRTLSRSRKDGLRADVEQKAAKDAPRDQKKLEAQSKSAEGSSSLVFHARLANKVGLKQPAMGRVSGARAGGGDANADRSPGPVAASRAPAPKGSPMPTSNRVPAYKQQLSVGESVRAQTVQKPAAKAVAQAVQSAPVLYNQATTSLAKGRVAEACALFASLVRGHRGFARRADALLGWARCEMARGAFGRAEAVVQQLIKEHPSWRKSGEAWLVEIQKQRQQAVLRAQQRARVRRQMKAAPRRATSRSSAPSSQ